MQTQLRERNDRLFQRLEQLQEKMTEMAKSKSQLSTKLVSSEEEKLKVLTDCSVDVDLVCATKILVFKL